MYEVDQASKDKLEEICDIRQPVLFDFDNTQIMNFVEKYSKLEFTGQNIYAKKGGIELITSKLKQSVR